MTGPAAVAATGLCVERGGSEVVRGVGLHVGPGRWLAVIGPNGAGKSTLLGALGGTLRPRSGRVHLLGRPLDGLRTRDRARLVASVPQHPVIPPGVRVLDYVLLGRTPHLGLGRMAGDHDVRTTLAVLQRLDLEELAGRPVDELSGGERQRAVLARAVAQEAPVLLLDEPTTSLDIGHQLEVLELVDELRRERDVTVVSSFHDLSLVGQFADEVALLVDGAVVAHGSPAQVLTPELIGRHYGAGVEVVSGADGVTVVARRRRDAPLPATPPPGSGDGRARLRPGAAEEGPA